MGLGLGDLVVLRATFRDSVCTSAVAIGVENENPANDSARSGGNVGIVTGLITSADVLRGRRIAGNVGELGEA